MKTPFTPAGRNISLPVSIIIVRNNMSMRCEIARYTGTYNMYINAITYERLVARHHHHRRAASGNRR